MCGLYLLLKELLTNDSLYTDDNKFARITDNSIIFVDLTSYNDPLFIETFEKMGFTVKQDDQNKMISTVTNLINKLKEDCNNIITQSHVPVDTPRYFLEDTPPVSRQGSVGSVGSVGSLDLTRSDSGSFKGALFGPSPDITPRKPDEGGGRYKRKTKKRKTNKRKTKKRKTNKRKTNKRKSKSKK